MRLIARHNGLTSQQSFCHTCSSAESPNEGTGARCPWLAPVTIRRRAGAFAQHEAALASALGVVLDGRWLRDGTDGSTPRQRRVHDAVHQVEWSHVIWCQQRNLVVVLVSCRGTAFWAATVSLVITDHAAAQACWMQSEHRSSKALLRVLHDMSGIALATDRMLAVRESGGGAASSYHSQSA